MVFDNLLSNAAAAKEILPRVIEQIPALPDWPEHHSLDHALVTSKDLWPPETVEKLRPIMNGFFDDRKRGGYLNMNFPDKAEGPPKDGSGFDGI